MQHYCNCHNTLTLKQGVTGLMDEVKEFIEEPSRDEFSDIVYCLNRLAGTLLNRPYVKVIPGDQLHVSYALFVHAARFCGKGWAAGGIHLCGRGGHYGGAAAVQPCGQEGLTCSAF